MPLKVPKFSQVLPFLLYSILLLVFLKMSWMKWGDLVIDSGKEWYVPEQILQGRVLYRDLAWLYGPFVPYWNALFLWIGGVHLHSLVASGILSIVLTVIPLHLIARRTLDPVAAGLTVATFLCVLAFGFYLSPHNYNYILPYTYAATYGMAFALWTLHCFYMAQAEGKGGPWAVLFLSLAALTRWEIGLVLALAMLLSTWGMRSGVEPGPFKRTLGIVVPALGITLVATGLFFALFVRGEGWTWEAIGAHLSLSSPFAQGLTGFDRTGQNLLGMAVTLVLYGMFTLFFVAAGRGLSGTGEMGSPIRAWALQGVVVAVITVPIYYLVQELFGAPAQFRCLPVLGLVLAWSTWKEQRKAFDPAGALFLATTLFSLGILARILLKVWPGQYGFTLLVPGLVVYHRFFLGFLPSLFADRRVRTFVRGGFLAVLLLFLGMNVLTEKGWYEKSTLPVGTKRGTLFFFPTEPAVSCAKFLDFLRQDAEVGDSLAVFPEGAALNFLSGLPNPLTDYVLNPVDLVPPMAQARAIDQLGRSKATYVALLQRDTGEYGPSAFGQDYGKDIMGYVFQNYSVIQQFGPFPYTTQFFGIVLLKRHSDKVIVK